MSLTVLHDLIYLTVLMMYLTVLQAVFNGTTLVLDDIFKSITWRFEWYDMASSTALLDVFSDITCHLQWYYMPSSTVLHDIFSGIT